MKEAFLFLKGVQDTRADFGGVAMRRIDWYDVVMNAWLGALASVLFAVALS